MFFIGRVASLVLFFFVEEQCYCALSDSFLTVTRKQGIRSLVLVVPSGSIPFNDNYMYLPVFVFEEHWLKSLGSPTMFACIEN